MRLTVEVPVESIERREVIALLPRDLLRRFTTLDAVREWVNETAFLPADTIVRTWKCRSAGILEVDIPAEDSA